MHRFGELRAFTKWCETLDSFVISLTLGSWISTKLFLVVFYVRLGHHLVVSHASDSSCLIVIIRTEESIVAKDLDFNARRGLRRPEVFPLELGDILSPGHADFFLLEVDP